MVRNLGSGQCGKLGIELRKTEAEVRAMVIRVLSDPRHARQVARTSAKLAAAQAKVDAAKADAAELGRRLGEGKITLDQYDVIIAPLEARIARLTAQAGALRDSGGSQAARTASIEEITTEWDNGDTTTCRVLIRRVAPRGIVVQVAPDGRAAHTIPASERLAII